EGRQQGEIAFGGREEDERDGRGEVAVDAVVEPFDEVADEARRDDAAQCSLLFECGVGGRGCVRLRRVVVLWSQVRLHCLLHRCLQWWNQVAFFTTQLHNRLE